MLSILRYTWQQHDHMLLLLAAAIWTVGSLCLFLILQRSLEFTKHRRHQWSAISACTGGIGVWATHFVAMLGHRDGMPMHYDIGLTAISVAIIIALFWIALRPLGERRDTLTAVQAGLISTAGVGLMHFIGMAAVTDVSLTYRPGPIVGATIVSSLAFIGAFVAFGRLRGWKQVAIPALLAIVAVCAVHFSAMAATTMTMIPGHDVHGEGDRLWLVTAIVVAVAGVLAATGTAFMIDRYLSDLKGLADATLEGLAIIHGTTIIEANARFVTLTGVEQRQLLGMSPDAYLVAADGMPLLTQRAMPVEVALMPSRETVAGDQRIFEAMTHHIEYRGRDCLVLALRDLTEERAAQRQIEHMARHDPLTDLPNRALLDERLQHAIALANREKQPLALLALDLDRFKAVNDIFGHAAGDQVLCRVAAILRDSVRATDTIARIGGDEFTILQVGARQPEGARALSERILAAFSDQMDMARDPTAVGVSIGVAVYPDDAVSPENLRHGADIALYRAKETGRGVACFFDQDMDRAVRERRALEHDLRHAVLRRQLHVAYQPLISTADGCISGYEALLRWSHPQRGSISPEDFIPIAEESGSIVQLGEWILREACATAATWEPHLTLAINVSPIQIQLSTLPDTIATVLAETGFPAERLELEITENVLMKDRNAALALLTRLKALGLRIVMDDFGTGYSSLSNLQSFPFDKIKIDKSFVAAMEDDNAARSIIRAIVGIGRSLSLPVVAEGVETPAQRRMITEEGCAQAQGFLFGHPERMDEKARSYRASLRDAAA
ncbi:EAL domain-containing protein [Sphingomonas sp. AP4-R1]|nr:EAL domain-containing protein [Sphingomonas sp. AP4-R1]